MVSAESHRTTLFHPLTAVVTAVLYVIILSAALDLVPASTPKGLILLFDIFPSLVAKSLWPYLSRGKVRYGQRIFWNTALSVGGVAVSGTNYLQQAHCRSQIFRF